MSLNAGDSRQGKERVLIAKLMAAFALWHRPGSQRRRSRNLYVLYNATRTSNTPQAPTKLGGRQCELEEQVRVRVSSITD
jgi:hypothetical protein